MALLLVTSVLAVGVGSASTATVSGDLSGVSIAYCADRSLSEYTDIVGDIEGRGASVTVITRPDAATLSSYDILWLDEDFGAGAGCTIGETEETAITSFVNNGGGLLVHGDDLSTPSTSLLSRYGIGTTSGSGGTTSLIANHPTTVGVSTVEIPSSGNLATVSGGAVAVVKNEGGVPAIAVAKSGSGRVAFMGEDYMWPTRITDADNRVLSNNVFDWLAGITGSTVEPTDTKNPRFDVHSEQITPETVEVGEQVNVSFTVQNVGDGDGDYAAIVTVDRTERLGRERVELDAGESRDLTFATSFDEPGTYQLWVRTDYLGTVEVTPQSLPEGDPADLDVEHLYTTRGEPAPGESYTVTAVVENTGNESMYTVSFVGDDGTQNRSVALAEGETRTVSVAVEAGAVGPATWTVGNRTVTVDVADDAAGVTHLYVTQGEVAGDETYEVVLVAQSPADRGTIVPFTLEAVNATGSTVVDQRLMWLSPGDTWTERWTVVAGDYGDVRWQAGGHSTANVTVSA